VQYELSFSEHVSKVCCIVMDEADFLIRLNTIVYDEEKTTSWDFAIER
jgi:hypothetical protein